MTAPAPASSRTPRKLTALHYCHLALGAEMTDEDGWQRTDRYGDITHELAAARERVALADISPVGKLDVKGPRSADWAGTTTDHRPPTTGEDLTAIAVAETRHRVLPVELRLQDQSVSVRCCELADDHRLILSAPEHGTAVREALLGASGMHVTDVTSVFAGLALIGPRSRELLRHLTALDVRPTALPDGTCAETSVAGVYAVLLRSDLDGLLAYEIYVTRDVAEFVWDAVLDAGREYGISPLGLRAYCELSR